MFSQFHAIHFRSDFCQDYSYWSDSNRCISKPNELAYVFARRCSTYESHSYSDICKESKVLYKNSSEVTHLKEYIEINFDNSANRPCLNSKDLCLALGRNYHHCPISKTCIPKSKICDGVPHCFYGDDENYELCPNIWPAKATILCDEANRSELNISILATPCNDIKECKHGEDENFCSQLKNIKFALQVAFVITMVGIWSFTYLLARRRKLTKEYIKSYSEVNSGCCVGIKGIDLAILKVSRQV